MQKADGKDERFRKLVIEETARKKAIREVWHERMKTGGISGPSIPEFAIASGLLLGFLAIWFFPQSIATIFVNTFLIGFFIGLMIGCCQKYIAQPIVESIIIDKVFRGKEITNRLIFVYTLPLFILWIILLIVFGGWIGGETIAHNGMYIWDWMGDLF